MSRLVSRFVTGLCAALFAVAAAAPSLATQNDEAAAIASDFDRVLAFAGSSPLSAPEKQRVAEETASALSSHPDDVRKGDVAVRKLLDKLAHDPPDFLAESRESLRLSFELQPQSDAARQIVEAHDPMVAFDRAHKRLVTERTLAEWRAAYAWIADLLTIPGPASDFIATERDYVRAHFASMPDARQEALAHVARNFPLAVALISQLPKAKADEYFRKSRQLAMGLDSEQRTLQLADMLASSFQITFDRRLARNGALLNSAANYNMLYHGGYMMGIYR
jgi:hypothetical protein